MAKKKIRVNLGGDRIGIGSKGAMEATLTAEKSANFNLSRVFKSSATVGTIMPAMVDVMLPGDKWNIGIRSHILTHPTVGPLFGNFKVEVDVFKVALRYYMAPLHNNFVDVGDRMSEIYMPLMQLNVPEHDLENLVGDVSYEHLRQIAPDSAMAYLGVRGLGIVPSAVQGKLGSISRKFNAIPTLAYADIYKQYYANLQEGVGAIMDADDETNEGGVKIVRARILLATTSAKTDLPTYFYGPPPVVTAYRVYNGEYLLVGVENVQQIESFYVLLSQDPSDSATGTMVDVLNLSDADKEAWHIKSVEVYGAAGSESNIFIEFDSTTSAAEMYILTRATQNGLSWAYKASFSGRARYKTFDLKAIDNMRMAILRAPMETPYMASGTAAGDPGLSLPYSAMWGNITDPNTGMPGELRASMGLNGLLLKTHLSDRFENWLRTDLVDGDGGITMSSSIDVSGGVLTMDALNLAKRVYEFLNRVVAAGNTYQAWLKAGWNVDSLAQVEMPIYVGGASGIVGFDTVVSTADVKHETGEEAPLGSLAGRGSLSGGRSKGDLSISCDQEPCLVMALFSITPMVDYAQGNEWWTRLTNQSELHKPVFDGIGFQDLLTDEFCTNDTRIDVNGNPVYRAMGKQPAFSQYMTAVDKIYGSFADPNSEMFMTLARLYNSTVEDGLTNGSTYINPTDYLQAFATSNRLDQHFWVQIAFDIRARRMMSAAVIPNL